MKDQILESSVSARAMRRHSAIKCSSRRRKRYELKRCVGVNVAISGCIPGMRRLFPNSCGIFTGGWRNLTLLQYELNLLSIMLFEMPFVSAYLTMTSSALHLQPREFRIGKIKSISLLEEGFSVLIYGSSAAP